MPFVTVYLMTGRAALRTGAEQERIGKAVQGRAQGKGHLIAGA